MKSDLTNETLKRMISDLELQKDYSISRALLQAYTQLLTTMQREAKLREILAEGAQCLWDTAKQNGGWAWEEMHDEMVAASQNPSEYRLKEDGDVANGE